MESAPLDRTGDDQELSSLRAEVNALREENARLRSARGESALQIDSSSVQEHAASILESITDGFVTIDPEWRYTYVNATAEKLLGVPRVQILGRTHWELYPATVGTPLANQYQKAMRERVVADFENYYDPWHRWFRLRVYPTGDGGVCVYFHDISEHKKTEEALRESDDRFRQLASTIDDVFWISEPKTGRILYVSPPYERLTGHTTESLYADPARWKRLIDPRDRARVDASFHAQIAEGRFTEEYRILRSDGTTRWVRDRGFTVITGSKEWVVGVCEDITERKHSEEAMRHSEERFRSTFENAAVGIAHVALDGRWLQVNDRLCEITGYSRAELLARTFSDITYPEDLEADWKFARELLAGAIPDYTMEKRYVCKDGSLVWVNLTGALQLNEAGEPRCYIAVIQDIDESKRARQALADAEIRFRIFIEHAPAAIAMLDREFRYVAASHRWLADYGLEGEDLTGRSHYDVFPDAPERWKEIHLRCLAGAVEHCEEDRFDRADGSVQWLRWEVRPWTSATGETGGLVIFTEDVSGRKRVEERLKDQLRLTEAITDNAAVSLFIMDERQECVFLNPAAEKLTGYTFDEVRGRPLHDVIHHTRPDGSPFPLSECTIDRAFPENNQVQGEEVFVHKDGTFYSVAYTASPVRDGDATVGTVIEVQDLTAHKIAAETILQREHQFHTLAESIPQLSWMANPDGHIFWYNRRWYEYTGTTPEAMEGWGWQSVHDPDVLPQVLDRWKESLGRGSAFKMIFPLKGADGLFRPFLTRVEPVKDAAGAVVRWFGTNTDVDELERAKEALRRVNTDLEHFAFAAAHDLQEPLRTVQSYTQLLSRRLGDKLEGDEQLFMTYVLEGARRMSDLVKDLREYLEVATTEGDEEWRAPVQLSAALEKAARNLEFSIEETSAEVVGEGGLPAVAGKEVHFVQLFQNLLSNAIKYGREGVPPRVSISARRLGAEWMVAIQDNGIGIPEEHRLRVFGLFKRLHGKGVPGSGIGLAICQKIVERYGGRIWVESSSGGGSTFCFTVPYKELA